MRYDLIRWFNIEVGKWITLDYCLSHGTLCSGQLDTTIKHISLEIGNKLDVLNFSHNDGLKWACVLRSSNMWGSQMLRCTCCLVFCGTLIQLFDLRQVIQQFCVVFPSCTIRNVEGYPNTTYNHFLPHYQYLIIKNSPPIRSSLWR
jgi:hypothetical protein